jgi:uncharacterized ParB-like nuclease family protein
MGAAVAIFLALFVTMFRRVPAVGVFGVVRVHGQGGHTGRDGCHRRNVGERRATQGALCANSTKTARRS